MFKLLAFWRKYTPFIDQKALMKRRQKICAGPPPLVWTKSKRTAAFFRDPFPYVMAAYGRKSAVRTKPEFDVTFLVTFGTLFRWLRVVLWQKLKQFLKKIWVGKCVHTSVWTTHALGAYFKARTFYSPLNISSLLTAVSRAFFRLCLVSDVIIWIDMIPNAIQRGRKAVNSL